VHMMGKDVDIHVVGVFEVGDDDKVSSWREYFDMKEIEAQLAG
jgi:limonene-1,2-epoxide hydrolase